MEGGTEKMHNAMALVCIFLSLIGAVTIAKWCGEWHDNFVTPLPVALFARLLKWSVLLLGPTGVTLWLDAVLKSLKEQSSDIEKLNRENGWLAKELVQARRSITEKAETIGR